MALRQYSPEAAGAAAAGAAAAGAAAEEEPPLEYPAATAAISASFSAMSATAFQLVGEFNTQVTTRQACNSHVSR